VCTASIAAIIMAHLFLYYVAALMRDFLLFEMYQQVHQMFSACDLM